jgi:hypothetical protein
MEVQCSFCQAKAQVIVAITQGLRLYYLNLCLDCYYRFYVEDKKGTKKLFCLRSSEVAFN